MNLKLKLPKLNIISIFLSYKSMMALILIIIFIVMGFLIWFLYSNIYQTITHSKKIVILKAEISPYSVNVDNFNQVLEKIENKKSQTINEWSSEENPFGFVSTNRPTIVEID